MNFFTNFSLRYSRDMQIYWHGDLLLRAAFTHNSFAERGAAPTLARLSCLPSFEMQKYDF